MLQNRAASTRRAPLTIMRVLVMAAVLLLSACSGVAQNREKEPEILAVQSAGTTSSEVPAAGTAIAAVIEKGSADAREPTSIEAATTVTIPMTTPQTIVDAALEQEVEDGQASEMAAHIEEALDLYAQAQQFSGVVLVARGGKPILAKGYGDADRARGVPNDVRTRFRIGSLTKQFTAMIVLILQERGLLDIKDSICDYIEDCPDTWSDITIEQLLIHTSGIPDFTRFPGYEATKGQASTVKETIDRFRNEPLDFAPGERWSYTNSGYILLGSIIEVVTGQSYEDVAQEYVFAPLGMTNTGYDHNRNDLAVGYVNGSGALAAFIDMSIPYAAGALYSTAEDLLKWDRALANGSLVDAALENEIFTSQASIPDGPGMGYGYGWIVTEEYGQPVVFHNGGIEGFVSNITRFLGDDTLIVMLSNEEQTNPNAVTRTVIQAIYAEQ